MKILYAFNGNSNGSISRANEIISVLQQFGTTDVLMSGEQTLQLPLQHTLHYRKKGPGICTINYQPFDYFKITRLLKNKSFLKELSSIPVHKYDIVINDLEPLTAWACRFKNIPCIGLGHSYSLAARNTPRPIGMTKPFAKLAAMQYAPGDMTIGLHFKNYSHNIFTPVIRQGIRNAFARNDGHYTVYLPCLKDKKIVKHLSKFSNTQWHIFSPHIHASYAENNCWLRPVNDNEFIQSLSSCEGIICHAGFETPAEALFLQKKLLIVNNNHSFEAACNAAALKELAVPVVKKIKGKGAVVINRWINQPHNVAVNYPDKTKEMIQLLLNTAGVLQKEKINQHPYSFIPRRLLTESMLAN